MDDSAGPGGGVYRAWRAVRELYPPVDHSFHLALGRGRRSAGAAADEHRVQPDLAAGAVFADWHRQEERDSDDRPGAAAGTPAAPEPAGVDPPGLSAALQADHDDHPGGDSRRAAADAQQRRRRGNAPAAGHHHCWRAGTEPAADSLHHAGDLPVFRPPAPPGQPLAWRAHRRCFGNPVMNGYGRNWGEGAVVRPRVRRAHQGFRAGAGAHGAPYLIAQMPYASPDWYIAL